MRGVFATGVLDTFLKHEFNPFDLCVGVSAGALNIAAYLADMQGRNYTVYTDYSLRPEFISVRRFLTGGHLMDLDWMWEITIRELRLDLDTILNARSQYSIGLTRVSDGTAVYRQPIRKNLEQMLKASSAIPPFYRGFVQLNGEEYADGGLADPIPVREAYRRGATRILVLRSRPFDYTMKRRKPNQLMRLTLRRHPELRATIERRAQRYNDALGFTRNPPAGVRILELNPPNDFESSRLSQNFKALTRDYRRGLTAGEDAISRWSTRA